MQVVFFFSVISWWLLTYRALKVDNEDKAKKLN